MNSWIFCIADIANLFLMERTLLVSYPRHKAWVKNDRIYRIGIFCVLTLVYIFTFQASSSSFLQNTVLYPVVLALYTFLFLDEDFFLCLSQLLLFTSIKATMPSLLSGILDLLNRSWDIVGMSSALFDSQTALQTYDVYTRILTPLCMFGFHFYLIRFATKETEKIPASYWLTIVFASVSAIGWSLYSFPEYYSEDTGIWLRAAISLCFLMINLMVCYLFYRITKQYTENLELKVLQLEHAANEDMNQMYLNLRQVRHDLANHIGIMECLLKEKHYEDLEDYFQSLEKNEYKVLRTIETGNVTINAMLNRKVSEIQEQGISIQTKVIVPPKSSISDSDLCAILNKLLANASEAVQTIGNGKIELNVLPKSGYLTIQCVNTVATNPLKENPHLHSTKGASPYHGLGLKIIRRLVNHYDGIFSIHADDREFCVDIMLPLLDIDMTQEHTSAKTKRFAS
ncbi:MAG: GHKL domain-containing protein [Lachnospiraceae bacterium]|nr:GHKL domain-containing protein [Lachnospiraceae bacterium]